MLFPSLILMAVASLYLQPSEGNINEYINNRNLSTENWTTCEQFLNHTSFEPESVIDIDWKIFYYWSTHTERSYHVRFSKPSSMLVDRFRIELDSVIRPVVNWSHVDLFVETSIDLSGLFVRTALSGKFRFIPSFSFQYHFSPWLEFALKVVNGYLGMMNCQQKVAYALAPVQKVPNVLEIDKVAAIFGIQNPLGRSYLTKSKSDPPAAALTNADFDDDLDVELRDITADLIF